MVFRLQDWTQNDGKVTNNNEMIEKKTMTAFGLKIPNTAYDPLE